MKSVEKITHLTTLLSFFVVLVSFITLLILPQSSLAKQQPIAQPFPIDPPIKGCQVGGCSGEICANEDSGPINSICVWREEFACLSNARCEIQDNGECGWTYTDQYDMCIADLWPNPEPEPARLCQVCGGNPSEPLPGCGEGFTCAYREEPGLFDTPGKCVPEGEGYTYCADEAEPPVCGNNICEQGEADIVDPGGCGPDAPDICLGPPARFYPGSCPTDCEVEEPEERPQTIKQCGICSSNSTSSNDPTCVNGHICSIDPNSADQSGRCVPRSKDYSFCEEKGNNKKEERNENNDDDTEEPEDDGEIVGTPTNEIELEIEETIIIDDEETNLVSQATEENKPTIIPENENTNDPNRQRSRFRHIIELLTKFLRDNVLGHPHFL